MTKEEFDSLMVGDEMYCEIKDCTKVRTKVKAVYVNQGVIISVIGVPYRYENCELVLKDKLVEFLCDNNHDGLTVNDNTFLADKIRQIVRKEVIDSLKFPSYNNISFPLLNRELFNWFIEQVKTLNR